MQQVVFLRDVKKVYQSGDVEITALDNTTLRLYKGELTLIMGPSGSGKTTLLSLIGCVIYPSAGEVNIQGQVVSHLSEKHLAHIRLQKIGFVFQQFNLLKPLTALENVMQPLLLNGLKRTAAKAKAQEALARVQLLDRQHNLPRRLSGGQQQRVAIARALVSDAEIILCDEPTASLDAKSAKIVLQELKTLAQQGKAIIIVTHDLRLREFADRIIYVEEGQVSDQATDEKI